MQIYNINEALSSGKTKKLNKLIITNNIKTYAGLRSIKS